MAQVDELKALLMSTLIRELSKTDEVDPRILSTAARVVKDFADELEKLDDEDEEAKRLTLQKYLDRRKNLKVVDGDA